MKAFITILIAAMMIAALAMPLISASNTESVHKEKLNDTGKVIQSEANSLDNSAHIALADSSYDAEQEAERDMNESVNGLKIGWNIVRTWFTFNTEKKVELEIQLAKIRLIQAKIAFNNNDTAALEKAIDAHESIMRKIQERLSAMAAENGGELNKTKMKLTGLSRAIQVHEIRIEILNRLLAGGNLTEKKATEAGLQISHAENITSKLKAQNISQGDNSDVTGNAIKDLIKKMVPTEDSALSERMSTGFK